eukprot:1161637-Pelagomonas_calceolata.AAC.1
MGTGILLPQTQAQQERDAKAYTSRHSALTYAALRLEAWAFGHASLYNEDGSIGMQEQARLDRACRNGRV